MKKLILMLICLMLCICVISCADNDTDGTLNGEADTVSDTSSDTETEATEDEMTEDSYAEYESINFENASVRNSNEDGTALFDESYTVNYDSYSVTAHLSIIESSEKWEEISSYVSLDYNEDFFEEKSLLIIEIPGASSTNTDGLTHIVIKDSKLTPVILMNVGGDSTTDIVYWYVTAEVAKADIEGYELGELEVEWNITEE